MTTRLQAPRARVLAVSGVLLELLLMSATPLAASARSSPSEAIAFTAPFRSFGLHDYPRSLAIGDINEDQHPDLVVSRYWAGSVSILLAIGNGDFTDLQDLDAGPDPQGIKLIDLDRDGHLDLVVVNRGPGTVSILLGRGDGTFLPRVAYAIGYDPRSLAVGDLNRDGVPDIATTNNASQTLSVLLGTGAGAFEPSVDVQAGPSPDLLAIADLNSDGIADLVATNSSSVLSHSVTLFAGRGDGSFEPGVALYSVKSEPKALAVADLNGDQMPDIAIGTTTLFGLLMNGDGTVRSRIDIAPDTYPFTSIAIGDLNHDGVADIAATHPEGGDTYPVPSTVAVLMGLGNGAFGPRKEILSAAAPTYVAIAEVGGDGLPDLITGSGASECVSVIPGNGDGTFGSDHVFETTGPASSIAVGDFNSDGHLDLVTSSRDTNTASVLLGRGDGGFGPKVDLSLGSHSEFVAVSDFNGDGRLDLAFAASVTLGEGTIRIFLGDGSGGFMSAGSFDTGHHPTSIAVADFNQDGKPDLAVAGTIYLPSVAVHLGNGDGTFSAPRILVGGLGHSFTAIVAGDIDHDGIPDLAYTDEYARSVSILLGIGDGTFGSRVDIPMPGTPSCVGMCDANQDGNLDLVVEADSAYVLTGRGDGSFRPRRGFDAGRVPHVAACADINGDGHVDIICEDFTMWTLAILLGSGDGTFEPPVTFGARGFSRAFPIADFNEDGRPDIAVRGQSLGVSIMLNGTIDTKPLAARAFLRVTQRAIPIGAGEPRLCIGIEPVDRSFELSAVDPSTTTMTSVGTGSTASIAAIPGKQLRVSDLDGNGVADLEICFAREDLARLFSKLHGKQTVEVSIAGSLTTGSHFLGQLTLTVVATGRASRAVVAPNPLNPSGTLTFATATAGRVRVMLFDIQGRQIRTLLDLPAAQPGDKQVRIGGPAAAGERLASGVYFYRIETPDGTTTGRFAVLK